MSPKTIWIINQYASTPETGIAGRHYYFARELAKKGYKVYLVAAAYHHLLRTPPIVEDVYQIQQTDGFDFVWVKMPKYPEAHSLKRIFNWFLFAWKLCGLAKVISDKPDVVLCSSPSLVSFLGAQHLSNRFNARLVFDVRDIWPLTLVEIGGYSPRNPFIRLLQWIEDKAYRKADRVTSNWPFAIEHMASRGLERSKFSWLPNGFSPEEFNDRQALSDETKARLPVNKFVVGYTGTLGTANALDILLETAERLIKDDSIAFVVVGGGKGEAELIEEIRNRDLTNVFWVNAIPKKQIPSMLSNFDICYVGFRKSPIYRFGNSLNKLPEYLMSGKPIVYSIDSIFKPVDDANAGITVPAEDSQAIAKAILEIKSMTLEQRKKLGENGKHYAEQNHDYSKLVEKLIKVMFE